MLELTDDVRQGLAKTAGHGALSFNTEEYAKAMDLKNSADDSFNVRGLPGGTFGQSVIDSTLGVAGNIDDFFGGPTGLGDYANNYVTAQEMAMGEKPEADFSWDYLINGLPRDTGNLIGSGIGLAAPIAAATLVAPFVGVGATAAGIGGALAGAGLESMAEGGQKMRDSLDNGDSLETAQDKARTVAGENMALLAPTNLLGLGALKKVGQGLKTAYNGGKAVSATGGVLANYPKLSQAADFAKGAGWAGLGAMNEGAQEAWQQGIQDSVEPDTDWGILPWNWNDEQTEAFESTIGPTALMAGAGGGARLAARKLGMSDVSQEDLDVDTPLQANNNLFGAGTAEISTQGADIDEQVAHLRDGYQSVIPQVAGVLVNDFGIEGAQISSGFRTREHNKEVGGAENSYHVGDGEHGDALDIVLPDGVSAETAEAIKQRFENSGVFDEVLFHDAGSGYHLHLGGLKTDNIGNSYGSYSGNADVDSAINEMAEKYNLDPALLAAMAEQESGFNQSAQSEAGAMGIMQLMPGTAEGLGVDPSDLRGNLEGGAKYLRQMLDKYDGDVEKALAAYNAGPGSLDSVNGDISQLSGETQKYVPSVMERYNKFKNKSGGGISSSGNILDWDSTNEDFSKLDFFPKDGEQSQGTVNEFLENLAKLEESDDKATKEKGRQAQDILQQYGDDTEKLTEKAKELGYQQTVNPAEVHGRIPMRRIVSTALNNGQVTFATKKAADIFASSPIGQTMERQGKTFKVTDNFKKNEQVNAISQQVYSDNTARTKTVKNGVMADAAAANRELNGQARPPIQQNDSVLTDEDRGRLISVMPNLPPQVQQQIQEALAENDIKSVRQLLDEATNSTPLNAETDIEKAKAITRALLQNPEATTSWDGNGAVRTAAIEGFINSNNLDGLNRANKYMAQNLRDKGINPLEVLNQNIEKPNTLPAVQGERMPSTDVQREEPAIEGIEGTVEDTVITPPYNGKPAYNENQLEAPAIESDHLNSEDFLAGLSPVERGFMEYLDKMFDNLQLGFNDVLEYLRARQKDIFNKRMESVVQQGPQGLTGAFYTNGGKMVVDNNMPQEVQNAWNQLLSMRKNFGASLANSTTEIQNEYLRVESVVKDYLTTTVTEQCKNNVSWRKLNYAITGLEAIADKARRYERSVSEEGKRGSTKSYRDISAEEGQAIEDSAVAWSGTIHQYGTTETRLRSFLNTLGNNFTKNNHGMALRAKTKYKGQSMNKAGRVEALIRDGGRVEERGKEYFAVSPNGDETKVTKGEHNYYKWLRQNGFAQQDRAPEGAPQLKENNGVTEDNYRARQPEYHGEESHEEYVKKEESTKGQTKPQSNDNPNASNEPMRKELIEQAAANEDTWVNSKKSELHLEDDNDTVVKLTPQELKYYQDLIKKGVVAKPELYEEAQEDVGEMDDNVEMSKEQKQLYDESNGDRDVPDSDSEPHTSGKSTKVVTADGKEYNVHYEVRPESEITVSNNLDGSVNKDYPSELQPRNRQRVGNLTQVAEIAGNLRPADLAENRMLNHGAPLIREDGVVLNGNGRIMAIRTAVKNGTDHGYKQYLIDHAEELGLNPDNIEHMENPVLVKVMDDELTADDVKAITTDTSGGQRMSASEQAKTDAKKIKPSTLNMYQPNESGELMGNNKYFLSKLLENILPADERNAYYTEDGSISKDGLMRAQRALFALAYGNDKLIDTFAETTNEQAKNLINALNANATTIAKLQRMIENGNAHDLKLRDNLVNAINALRSAVLDGKPAERIWKETSMFEEAELTPETKALAKAMDGFRKSGKKLTNFIAQLADNNLRHGDPKQETMFEGTDDFSLMKDIASAKDKIANGGQANIFEEPRAKYSREKSPVDEKNNQQENVTIEFEADTPAAQKVFDEQLTDEVKRDLRNTIAQQMTDTIEDFEALSDEVKMDRAFADLPIIRTMRVVYQTNTIQDSENNKSKLAARYEYARRCFLYDKRVPNGINRPATSNEQQKRMVGNQQKDGTKFNGSPKKQRLRENDGSGTAVPSLGEYKFIKKQFDKLVDDKLKHSSRDKSAFSIEPINPHSAESLKENGNSDTELDRLPKVPIAKLRQSEQKIVRFGKAIGVPVHFVESNETTNRGVFTHNGEIFINRKATVPAHSIFVHEFVHWLKASPENAGAYDVLHACLENSSGLFNEARINKYRGKIFDGEKMTDEEIVEEIICDAMTHTESAEKLMRAVNNVDGSLVTRIAGCLKAMWDKFCEYMNFKQHKMSNEQHLPNELSVAEFQRADTAFNKILMNLKNDNGELVFHRVGTELLLRDNNAKPVDTYQLNPISYTYAVAYSKENKDNEPIDGNDNQQDNMVIEFDGDKRGAQLVFNKYLTQGLKDLTRQTIKDEITENIKDFEKLNDPVELDKALNELPFFKKIRGQFQNNVITSNPEYMHRMATRYEYARRCFLNDSRIPNESVRRVDVHAKQDQISRTDGNSFPQGDNAGKKQTLSGRTGKRLLNSGITSTTPGEYKFIKNHFDKLVDDTLKHSEQGAFSNGNKYSRGVDLSPSTDGVAIAARANNNLVANMKGIVKKANAKFNPFHHEELENLRIDKRDKEKDLNLIEYQFVSPTRESKKYKAIQPFVMKGKQAMAKQEKLRFEFNEGMNELDKLLGWREGFHRNDSKFKERKEALNEILLKGDLERKDFTNKELIEAGYDAETIKGYHKMKALLDKAWKLADETKSRIKYQSITSSTLRRAEADFADLKDKNPFAEIISKVHNPDGTVTINYKAPHVRRVAKQTVLPSELENLRKNKDVHIVETTQSLKGTTQVTYYQREAGMGKLKGYIPHIFHGWYVCKVDKDGKAIVDEDGNVAMDNIMTTANSLSEAAKLGREFAKANPNANYRVIPQTFSAPGAQEQAIVMGDFDYAKIVGKVADSMSMSISDAQAMLDNTVKMKNRGRFYGYAKQRKGFKGFEQNVYLATMKYFNQTARYAAMDSFKRDSISMYNRIFGAFDDENVTKRSAMAKWTKQYISDMNGTPTWIEKMINNTLHNFGLGEERAGGRPALWLQQKIFTYPMTILKLGVFNPSSALLNLTQLFNLYGAMGEKVLSPQAYQRLLHKGFADTFRAMSNKDSELGKLLWKDLGLDYQIGMDIASGYSNAEVSNLASLRGFASRLAGKSMYLFRQSDAFARGVTLLTAYNKALDEGKSKAEAIEYAKQINDKVNFDYSVADEPTIFRALGPISKVFLQFKKYPVKQLELFQDFYLDGRELGLNRKQSFLRMVKYVAPYMAMSGMMGIPFVSFLGGLISYGASMIYGDDDWDWEKKIKQLMITEFGEDSPITQWWLYGAGSFIGLNLGGRVGVGDFLGSDSYNSADGLGGLMWNQTTLGSTVNQVRKQLSYRNYAEALKAINPTMGNIALAYKGEVRTTRGRMKYQYQNMAERMWRAIGFTPLNETLAGDLASNEYTEKQEQTKAKQKAVDDFLANPSSENAARLNELGVTPKSLENESARRTMNRHQLNELAKEKEAAKKKKKPKTYSASDYLKAVQ